MGIRTRIVVVGLVGMVTAAHAESPPPLDEAIKQAAAARKPLLLEFHADWCMPCKEFEAKTLPDKRVQSALNDVVFVRYDVNDDAADEASVKFHVSSYPTFIVVDKQGIQRDRREGAFLGEDGINAFVALIRSSRFAAFGVEEVIAEIKAKPKDIALRLSAARWFAEHDQVKAALVQYDAVSTYKEATAAERTLAAAAAVRLRRVGQWRQQLLAEKRALVRASPKHADEDDIAIAVLSPDTPAEEARKLIAHVIEAQTDMDRLNGFAYVALSVGANQEALEAGKRVVADRRDAQRLDTLAECYFQLGDRKQAVALADEAVRLAKGTKHEGTLRANRSRFDTGKGPPSEVRQYRARIRDLWKRFDSVDLVASRVHDHDEDSIGMYKGVRVAMKAREAREALAKTIGKTCASSAGTIKQAAARIEVDSQGRVKSSVLMLEPSTSSALSDCVTKELAAASIIHDPFEPTPSIMIDFAK